MKVLFLTQTDIDGPASRYRVYQYLEYLQKQGIDCSVSPGIAKGDYLKIYAGFHPVRKLCALIGVVFRRIIDLLRISQFDIIFIQREISPQVFPLIEKIIKMMRKKVIFDFDDAIFLVPPQRNSIIYKFRFEDNIKEIIKESSYVLAGNDYLLEYALDYNPKARVIPTCVDTNRFIFKEKSAADSKKIIIGWIGTEHSLLYLEDIKSVFQELSKRFKISLHVMAGVNFNISGVEVINKKWDINTEVADLHELDIGVAPLKDDGWGKGKCGLKALQYMSCGIPVVCSPAGVYKTMIVDGENGLLAANANDWIEKLTLLIKDAALRKKIALQARNLVEAKYSLKVNAPKIKEVLELVFKD